MAPAPSSAPGPPPPKPGRTLMLRVPPPHPGATKGTRALVGVRVHPRTRTDTQRWVREVGEGRPPRRPPRPRSPRPAPRGNAAAPGGGRGPREKGPGGRLCGAAELGSPRPAESPAGPRRRPPLPGPRLSRPHRGAWGRGRAPPSAPRVHSPPAGPATGARSRRTAAVSAPSRCPAGRRGGSRRCRAGRGGRPGRGGAAGPGPGRRRRGRLPPRSVRQVRRRLSVAAKPRAAVTLLPENPAGSGGGGGLR